MPTIEHSQHRKTFQRAHGTAQGGPKRLQCAAEKGLLGTDHSGRVLGELIDTRNCGGHTLQRLRQISVHQQKGGTGTYGLDISTVLLMSLIGKYSHFDRHCEILVEEGEHCQVSPR